MLPLTILLELGGGLAILFGFLTRTTAIFTFGFTVLTALLFHSNFAEGANQLMFMKNFTIAGGYLLLAVTGRKFSIDYLLKRNGNCIQAKSHSNIINNTIVKHPLRRMFLNRFIKNMHHFSA